MSDNTSIEWTDASWNPLRARGPDGKLGWYCEKVSRGCAHCYAERMNLRLGTGGAYSHLERTDVFLDEGVLAQPSHWRRPRMVFVCSMTDLFGHWVTDEDLHRVFAAMATHPRHTFQVLTKRADRLRAYMNDPSTTRDVAGRMPGHALAWPPPNVWLGVSVEDQESAAERIPHLLATTAAVRFLSCEPLLEDPGAIPAGLDWLIVGGESGADARPFQAGWARSLVAQCWVAGVAVFVKQLGANPWDGPEPGDAYADGSPRYERTPLRLRDRKGGDPAEWEEGLRVRDFPAGREVKGT